MKKLTTVAASAAIVASFATATAMAAENPFGMQKIDNPTSVAMSEGTCGEGKCGDKKDGEGKTKTKEGKCGDSK